MKTSIFYTLLLLCLSTLVYSQVDIRIAAGPQWSNAYNKLINDARFEYDFRTGFHFNGVAIFNTSKKFQPYGGVGMATNGTVYKSDLTFTDQNGMILPGLQGQIKVQSTLLQVEIPIGMLFYFKEPNKGLFVDGGLKPSLLLQEFRKAIVTNVDGTDDVSKARNNDWPKKFNVIIRPGIGYQFQKLRNLSITAFGEIQTLNWAINGFKYYQYAMGISAGIRL